MDDHPASRTVFRGKVSEITTDIFCLKRSVSEMTGFGLLDQLDPFDRSPEIIEGYEESVTVGRIHRSERPALARLALWQRHLRMLGGELLGKGLGLLEPFGFRTRNVLKLGPFLLFAQSLLLPHARDQEKDRCAQKQPRKKPVVSFASGRFG